MRMESTREATQPGQVAGALRTLDDLPGPRGLPFLGNALQLDGPRLHRQLEEWSLAYGDYYRVQFMSTRFLVVADHAEFAKVLRDRPEKFRRSDIVENIVREMGFRPGVFFVNDETWRRQRRMVMESFSPGNVRAFFPTLHMVAQRLEQRWRKAAANNSIIDLRTDLMCFTVDAIAGLALGTDVNTLGAQANPLLEHMSHLLPAIIRRSLSPVPYWRLVRLPADRALERSVPKVNSAIQEFIAQARRRLAQDPELRAAPGNLLEAMIVAADAGDAAMDDQDVAANVLVMLMAGQDTTASSLAWMIDLLWQNPDALARVTEEVRRVAPDPREITFDTLASLEYVEACIHETMRLKPVAPFMDVQAVGDTQVGDVRVPAGTILWGLMRRDSLMDEYFPQARSFQPERWLAAEGERQRVSSKQVAMPFGSGPRICPGRYLALVEMKLAIATLVSSFAIEEVGTADGSPAREHMVFTMRPEGLRMRLRAAAAAAA